MGDEEAPVVNSKRNASQTTLYSFEAVATMEDDNGKTIRDFYRVISSAINSACFKTVSVASFCISGG